MALVKFPPADRLPEDIRALIDERDAARRRANEAKALAQQLADPSHDKHAKATDERALAEAARAGKDISKIAATGVAQLEAQRAAAQRDNAAKAGAVTLVESDLREAIQAERNDAEARRDEQAVLYRAAIDELIDARGAYLDAAAVASFFCSPDDYEPRKHKHVLIPVPRPDHLTNGTAWHGMTFDELVAALVADAQPEGAS